jgi:hypothetical protein
MAEQKSPFTPNSSGANAFKAAYDRLKAEADAAKKDIGTNYSGAYQQLRQQGYGMGLGASAQKGLSGGQGMGVQQQTSARQMGALGNLMQGQEQALRSSKLAEGSIYSNALLEGQQAQEMEATNRDRELANKTRASEILADNSLSEQEKNDQLVALGIDPDQAAEQSNLEFGKLKNFSGFAGADLDFIKNSSDAGLAYTNPENLAEHKRKLRLTITSMINEIRILNPGITPQQILNRMKRKGIPIEQYGFSAT